LCLRIRSVAGATIPGEGIVYVSGGYTSGVATLAGSVTANTFTKFGNGTLLLSNANAIEGLFAMQAGVLQLGQKASGPVSGSLLLNDTATLDLRGTAAAIGNLGGSQGLITNLSAGNGVLTVFGNQNTTFSGNITNGAGTTKMVKTGANTLTLSPLTAGNMNAGNNTFTGGVNIYAGNVISQNPFGLGGFNNTTPGPVTLYGGGLNLQSNGAGPNGVIVYGNPNTLGLNLRILGNASVSVDRPGANSGNAIQVNTLSLANATLTVAGGNNYRLLVAGTTSIQGNAAIFSASSNVPQVLELAGPITDGGRGFALTRGGSGTGAVVISGTSNTYGGGTNITSGYLQVTGTAGTPARDGPGDRVPREHSLRIAGDSSLQGVSALNLVSTFGDLAMLTLDGNFTPECHDQERIQLDLGCGTRAWEPFTTAAPSTSRGRRCTSATTALRSLRSLWARSLPAWVAIMGMRHS
jgi:fibronectin-binding autotransporter adhesin